MEILNNVFLWILISSSSASVLGVIIMLIKLVFKMKISPRIYCILWFVVCLKFIIGPFAPASVVSVFNLINYEKVPAHQGTAISHDFWVEEDKNSNIIKQVPSKANRVEPVNQVDPSDIFNAVDTLDTSRQLVSTQDLFAMIWFLGFCTILFIFISSGRNFAKKLNELKSSEDEELLEIIKTSTKKFNIKETIPVFISAHTKSPCIIGILRPKIILHSKLDIATQQREITHMIMHELAHFKRKDNMLNFVIIAVTALHWFNPIIWLIFSHMKLDIELACDACVLETLGEEEAIPYGMTLIKSIRLITKKQPKIGFLNFYDTKKQIERRIKMIKAFKKGNYRLSKTVVVICLMLSFTTLTNAVTNTKSMETTEPTKLNTDSHELSLEASSLNMTDISNDDSSLEDIKFQINRSDKSFNNLKRAKDFIDFDFKVPDFLPDTYQFEGINVFKELVDSENRIDIYFTGGENHKYRFTYTISKGNLLEDRITKYNTHSIDFQKASMGIEKITGTVVTAKSEKYIGKDATEKYFIWQDEGVWYEIYFSFMSQDYIMADLPQEDLIKVVQSMKKTQDIEKVNYVKSNPEVLNIYDETDLKKAEALLGFKSKFPLSLSGGCKVFGASAIMQVSYENDHSKVLRIDYLPEEYLKKSRITAIEFFNSLIAFEQMKDMTLYDRIKEKGFVTAETPGGSQKIMAELLRIEGIDVYSLDGARYSEIGYSVDKDRIIYVWKENDSCYRLACAKNINNKQEIIKNLILKKL
jgi:bla regulator protein BlaR1